MSSFPPEGAFLGLEPPDCDAARSRFAVLPVPYEKTTTYAKGTAQGPAAILFASAQVELYDERGEDEPAQAGITTLPAFEFLGTPEALADALEKRVGEVLRRGQVPVILGGEHSISLGPLRATKRAFPTVGVLHFDAHGDLRDEYEGTRYGHGCVMRRVLDEKVAIVQVGVRSLSSEEAAVTRRARPGAVEKPPAGECLTFYAHDLPSFGDALPAAIASCLPDPVYLSFDVDALDSSLMPATGTPEPGGLLWEPVLRIIDAAARARRIVAMDFVELMPRPGLHACEFLTARLAYRAIGSVVRGKQNP